MNKHVLVVEDDLNDAFFISRAFKKAGLETPLQIVTDGQIAIAYLEGSGKYSDRDLHPLPCLILTDLKLPLVKGLELLKWIRERAMLHTPVLILSSSADEREISEAYRLGANAYVAKPSEASDLLKVIASIREFWLSHNTPPPQHLRL